MCITYTRKRDSICDNCVELCIISFIVAAVKYSTHNKLLSSKFENRISYGARYKMDKTLFKLHAKSAFLTDFTLKYKFLQSIKKSDVLQI